MGDTQYHIKLRCSGPGDGGTSLQHSRDHIGAPLVLTVRNDCLSVCHPFLHSITLTFIILPSITLSSSSQPDDSHYYGFVYFRQVKDTDIKRGYFQKSVVLLTRLPYITFFTFLVSRD